MYAEQIEKVKTEYTDKYVVVDAASPELARFRNCVGQVKTVNMSGRALVEFSEYHQNIGWYDIGLDYLRVVDKPAPKDKDAKPASAPSATKPSAAKPAAKQSVSPGGEKKLSPLELARMQGSGAQGAAKDAAPAKSSTADILAAARGGSAAPAAKAKPSTPPGEVVKSSPAKRSTADILAAARGGTASQPTPAAAAPPAEAPEPGTVSDVTPSDALADESAAAATDAPSPAATGEGGIVKIDRSSMSVEEMIAYCRAHDC